MQILRHAIHLAFRPWTWAGKGLREKDFAADPFTQFTNWYRLRRWCFWLQFPDAVCLATVGNQGEPQARMVLLKEFSQDGFVFYTNLDSTKGQALAANPRAALCFYWDLFGRQVRVQGRVEQVSDQEADAYFASRPRLSQIGSWASLQSRVMESKLEFEERIARATDQYKGQAVPRPKHWSGFRLNPDSVEFWQIRGARLHDRLRYRQEAEGWVIERLYP